MGFGVANSRTRAFRPPQRWVISQPAPRYHRVELNPLLRGMCDSEEQSRDANSESDREWSTEDCDRVEELPSTEGPTYAVFCTRNQLRYFYDNNGIPDGVYFYDSEYVVRVEAPSSGTPVDPLTAQLMSKLDDVPTLVGYFLQGSLLGGKRGKKKNHSEKKAPQHPKGKGAYGAPMAVSGSGGFSLRGFSNALKNAVKPLANSVTHAGLEAARGHALSAIAGTGAYKFEDETITNNLINNTTPTVGIRSSKSEEDSVVILGVAYIGNIFNNTSSALTGYTFPCNPGLPSFCPHLSENASYTTYMFEQLCFIFQSDISSTYGSLGNVLAYSNMNPFEAPATSTFEITNTHGGEMCRADQHLIIGVECDDHKTGRQRGLLIRRTGVDPDTIGQYDYCSFNIYTFNIPTGVVPNGGTVGRVYAYYKVRMFERRLAAFLGKQIRYDGFAATTGLSSSTFVGANQVADTSNNGGSTTLGINTMVFGNYLVGTFEVTLYVIGVGFSSLPSNPSPAGQVRLLTMANGATAITTGNSTNFVQKCWVILTPAVTNGGNTLTFIPGSFGATSITFSCITIRQAQPLYASAAYLN